MQRFRTVSIEFMKLSCNIKRYEHAWHKATNKTTELVGDVFGHDMVRSLISFVWIQTQIQRRERRLVFALHS